MSSSNIVRGKVYVGMKHKRGVSGDVDTKRDNCKTFDCTSGSMNKLDGKLIKYDLSPMLIGPVVDEQGNTSLTFENYWQYSKLWKAAGHIDEKGEATKKWYDFRAKGFSLVKGKRRPFKKSLGYGAPEFAIYNNKKYDYLTARKEIYVPVYAKLVRNSDAIKAMKRLLDAGQDIMVICNDGAPRDLCPQGMEMNKENWDKMINDTSHLFGHSQTCGAILAGLI